MTEIKNEGKPGKLMTTSDMLTHPWILVTDGGNSGNHVGIKKKKSASSLVVDFSGS